jgi:hypothetical protein
MVTDLGQGMEVEEMEVDVVGVGVGLGVGLGGAVGRDMCAGLALILQMTLLAQQYQG